MSKRKSFWKMRFWNSKVYVYVITPAALLLVPLIASLILHPMSRRDVFNMMRAENVAYYQIEDDIMFFAVYTGRITGWGDRRYDVLIFSRSTVLPRYRLVFEFYDTLAHSVFPNIRIPAGWHNYRVNTVERPVVSITSFGIRPPRSSLIFTWAAMITTYINILYTRRKNLMKNNIS